MSKNYSIYLNPMSADERKRLIFEMALIAAQKKGLFKFTVCDVSMLSMCSISLVKHYYGGIKNLRKCIIKYGDEENIDWIKNTSITEILK